jgi:hypothetical protein
VNISEAKDSRSLKFIMKRVGIDPGVLDEIEASNTAILLTHHLLVKLAPDVHDTLHANAEAATKAGDNDQFRKAVVCGKCLVDMVKFLYAERHGGDGLALAIAEFQKVKA